MVERLTLPDSAPVMILKGCNFFPGTPLPLRIFEPKYRMMLALALEGERMFCMGTECEVPCTELGVDQAAGIYQVGTVGLIRACVRNQDGTSNLLLEGLQRVKFLSWIREQPFRIAQLEPIETEEGDWEIIAKEAATVAVLAKISIERGLGKLPEFDLIWAAENAPELLGDLVANYLVMDCRDRHRLLESHALDARLTLLAECLKGQLGSYWQQLDWEE